MKKFDEMTKDRSTRLFLDDEGCLNLSGEDDEGIILLAENAEQVDELIAMLGRARVVMATRWFVKIDGTSMLAPYLSEKGALAINDGGEVFANDVEAWDFGCEEDARAWLREHPDHPGQVVAFLPR